MPHQKLIQFLRLHNFISTDTAIKIAGTFTSKEIRKNEFFLREGKISDAYLFLESGFMRAFAVDTEGRDISTNFYSQSAVVFEVHSFFNRTASRENIQALTDCIGWVISFDELNYLFHALPEFREFGRHILVKGYSGLKNRMLAQITESAEQRYERLISTNPEIFQFAQLKHIASYLGVTDTSLSRIRKEFSKKF